MALGRRVTAAAREAARQNRARIQQGEDVAAEKRADRLKAQEQTTVATLAQAWYDRHIAKTYKHHEVVLRVLRRHIGPVIGKPGVTESGRCTSTRCSPASSMQARQPWPTMRCATSSACSTSP